MRYCREYGIIYEYLEKSGFVPSKEKEKGLNEDVGICLSACPHEE